MKKEIILFTLILLSTFVLGCIRENVVNKCINKCLELKNKGVNLSNGPCIDDFISNNWVCDVAHSPRESIDNLAENQCQAFRNGTAKHYVEVDTNCNFIREY